MLLGGVCLLAAAFLVRFVDDVGADAPVRAHPEPALSAQGTAQPVPSEGLAGR